MSLVLLDSFVAWLVVTLLLVAALVVVVLTHLLVVDVVVITQHWAVGLCNVALGQLLVAVSR